MLWGGAEGGTGDGETDTFVIDDLSAADIIGDFEAGIDEIDLTALLTLPGGTDVETGGTSGYVDYDSGTGDLKVDAGGNVGTSGTVVANLGTGLANETIKILFDDGGTGGSDVV